MTFFNKENAIFFFCYLLMASMIYSPFLLSASMIALGVLSLSDIRPEEEAAEARFDQQALRRLSRFWRRPPFMALTLFFFIVLFSFWQTEDYGYWLARLRIKLPFLALPLLFITLPRFSERQVLGLFYGLLAILLLTSLGIGINYFLHYEEIIVKIKEGHPIPTPRNHIRFSLLLAYGIIGGAYLYVKRFYWRYPWERQVILGITIFLFLFMHFLSVRTGLAALYIAILVSVGRYVYLSRKYWLALGVIAGLFLFPLIGYNTIPSFKAKVGYMLWDWKMYREGRGALYADSGRLTSLRAGYDIFKENPIFGVGAGNLRAEVSRVFKSEYPDFQEPLVPHNQFLFVMAGTGLFGLTLFLFAFLFPLFYRKAYREPLLLAFYAIVFTAFMLEHMIENSIGVAFFLFFVLLWLNRLQD